MEEIYPNKRSIAVKNKKQFYFTGKTCSKGHLYKRYTSNGMCVQCHINYYYSNHELMLKKASKYKEKNREKINQKWRDEYKKNPEKHKKESLEYYYNNKDKVKEYNAKRYPMIADQSRSRAKNWARNNKERVLDKVKKWQKRNIEKVRVFKTNCAIKRKKNAVGSYFYKDVMAILKSQKYKCVNCKCDVSKKYHVDHIMPLSKGGSNWPKNLQILCQHCNCTKQAKDPIAWAQENGRLL